MSYLDDHLLGGEQIIYRARLHWIIFGSAIVVVAFGLVLAIVLQATRHDYWYLGMALVGVGLLLAIGPAIRYLSSEFAVTTNGSSPSTASLSGSQSKPCSARSRRSG